MACGEFGPGRMAEPPAIFEAILAALAARRPGRWPASARWSPPGPTAEPIDPVRLITNRSSRQAGLCHRRRPGGAGRRGHPGQRPDRPAGPGRRAAGSTSRPRARCWRPARRPCRPTSPSASPPWPTGGRSSLRRPQDQEGRGRPAGHQPGREPRHPGDPRRRPARRGRSWWSASPPRPTTWRPTPRPSSPARAATGSSPTTSASSGTMGGDENAVAIVSKGGIERWDRLAKGEVARRLAARIARGVLSVDPDRPDHPPAARPRACRCRPTRPPRPPAWTCAPPCRRTSRWCCGPGDAVRRCRPGLAFALPAGLRGPGAAALGPGAQGRRHLPEHARHHRRRLPRRGEGDPDQPRRRRTSPSAAATASPSW